MKIVSHNINGINAYKNNGKLNNILELNADVYCLQEVKKNDIESVKKILVGTQFENYVMHYSFSTFKKGYAGVLTLIKPDVEYITEHHPEIDDNIILENLSGYGSGRIVTTEFDKFYLVNMYVVNSGGKSEDRKQWDDNLIKYLNSLNKPYIICGDMNVCSTYKDYWGNYEKSIDTCAGLMKFEIDGFNKLINECNLVDTYRFLHENERKYSWLSPFTKDMTKGWRLDYFLVSNELNKYVLSSDVLENWQKNDHMPIILEIII